MTSKVDIVNRALSAIAARSTIANYEAEQSKEAKEARLLYEPTRDALLRAAHWNFARKTAYLTLLKSAPGTPENPTASGDWNPLTMPAPPWLYEYAYPSDCLLIRYVTPPAPSSGVTSVPIFSSPAYGPQGVPKINAVRFTIAAGQDALLNQINVVNTNAQQAIVCYTVRATNEDLWDALFQEAMVTALGARMAMSVTGNLDVARLSAAQARSAILEARSRDGNEGLTKIESIPDWIKVRGLAGDYATAGESNFVGWSDPSFLVM